MRKTKLVVACSACLIVGWFVGQREPLIIAQPAPRVAPPLPQSGRLGASLWMTSAEYRACCVQTYYVAEQRLRELLRADRPAKPAIVMDLDETVLDNSAFQTFLYKSNFAFTEELWAEFEMSHPQDVGLVPGAKTFIERAQNMNVKTIFISNRTQLNVKSTESALQRLGLTPYELQLRSEKGSSDKSSRREAVAAKYNVVMLFGDNLRDFSEAFAARKVPASAPVDDFLKAMKERDAQVDGAACHWGVDWFILPNPHYGEWEKLIGPRPIEVLRPTSMTRP
jgi:5'-nucleotidase (lipoprotein e(P4) family)